MGAIRSRRALAAIAAAGGALVLAGCSSGPAATGGSSTTTAAAGGTTSTTAANGATTAVPAGLRTESTKIGTVLATSAGHTIYELVGATSTHTACTGICLSVWPAVTVGGPQVVVGGHPAYRFAGDTSAGQVNGQGLRDQWGTWWALGPSGRPITTSSTTSTTSSTTTTSTTGAGSGSGSGY